MFGALLLAGNGVRLTDFEADSAIVKIYPKALAAIDISCSDQTDKVEDALKQIPIRSPYRDLRTLLTGLHHFSKDKAKGREFLRKITADSPYHYCAARFFTTADSPKSLLATLAATAKSDRSRLPELHGLPVSHLRVLEELARANSKPMHLYQIVRRNERHFSKSDITELYRNIIPFCREQAVDILERSTTFALAEKLRLCALAAEQDDIPRIAVAVWSDYLQKINLTDPARHREIAMVIRHQATLMKRDRYEYSPQEVLDTMLKSLEYDAGHAQTWMTITTIEQWLSERCRKLRHRATAVMFRPEP